MTGMSARSWVTLVIRLMGLASVLLGVYNLISIIEVRSSPFVDSMSQMAKDTPMAAMFSGENFRPSYVGPTLWIGAGLTLMLIGGPLGRFLFSGLESRQAASTTPVGDR